jgi:hypothetical protein
MSKWGNHKIAMWILVVLMTWTAAAAWMDNDLDFQLVFFSLFGLCAFAMLAILTIMDILNISWGGE